MKIFQDKIKLTTKEELEIIDITEKVVEIVLKSKVKDGIVNIQSMHTTAAVVINEKESQLWKDIKKHLSRLAPNDASYFHDDFTVRTENMCEGECANGHSHCKALHLPTNACLNIKNGKLDFGLWQRILFIELDRKRPRSVSVTVLG